jgi:hypothetical protein
MLVSLVRLVFSLSFPNSYGYYVILKRCVARACNEREAEGSRIGFSTIEVPAPAHGKQPSLRKKKCNQKSRRNLSFVFNSHQSIATHRSTTQYK